MSVKNIPQTEAAVEAPASDSNSRATPYGNNNEETVQVRSFERVHKVGPEDPRREKYRIAAMVTTGIALLTAIGSVITAGVMWQRAYDYTGTDTDRVLYASLYIFMLVEGCLSFIAMLVYFSVLFYRPNDVLIRDGQSSKFLNRCITVFLLFLLSVYSFCVPLVLKDRKPLTSPALCVVPGVRFICLLAFFIILIADSRL